MKDKKTKVVILSGAGVSAESGIKTFRDNGGLWEEHKVEDVATPKAFKEKTQLFLDFYNDRKNHLKTTLPNKAHEIIKEMEEDFDVTIVTQNIDDLHERAGSKTVIHLHGELTKLRSSGNENYKTDYIDDLKIGDLCPKGHQLRPNVVLFHENLPSEEYYKAVSTIHAADVVIVVGTSLKVYPAAGLPWESKDNALIYYVDPADVDISIPKLKKSFFYHIKEKATKGMQMVYDDIKDIYL